MRDREEGSILLYQIVTVLKRNQTSISGQWLLNGFYQLNNVFKSLNEYCQTYSKIKCVNSNTNLPHSKRIFCVKGMITIYLLNADCIVVYSTFYLNRFYDCHSLKVCLWPLVCQRKEEKNLVWVLIRKKCNIRNRWDARQK